MAQVTCTSSPPELSGSTNARRTSSKSADQPVVGYCIIIDNSSSSTKQSRYLPVKRLSHVLKERHNLEILYFTNLSIDAVQFLSNKISTIDHSELNCLIFIMINSELNNLHVTNISTNEIIAYFSDENCLSLANKPKLFLFQTLSNKKEGLNDKIKLSCLQSEEMSTDVSMIFDTLHSYTETTTTGSIFVGAQHRNEVIGDKLSQSFFLSDLTHSTNWNIRQMLVKELMMKLSVLISMRETLLTNLNDSESLVIKTCHDVYTSRLVGGTGGVAGTLFTITGLALIPVTLGISLVVTGVGAGIGAAAGVTILVTSLSDAIEKNDLRKLRHCMILDSQLSESVCTVRDHLRSLSSSTEDKDSIDIALNSYETNKNDDEKFIESMDLIDIATKVYKQLNDKKYSSIVCLKDYIAQQEKDLESLKNLQANLLK
jgi:hypothetical protein